MQDYQFETASKRTVIRYGAMDKPSQDAAGQIQTAATSTYRGVRGWLLFFVLSLTVFTPLLQAYIIYSEKQSYNATPSPLLLSVLAIDWAMRGILIVCVESEDNQYSAHRPINRQHAQKQWRWRRIVRLLL